MRFSVAAVACAGWLMVVSCEENDEATPAGSGPVRVEKTWFGLERQEQILGMIRHLLKTVAAIKIDGRWLCVDHEANTANFISDACCAGNRIEEHDLPNPFPLVAYCGRKPSE